MCICADGSFKMSVLSLIDLHQLAFPTSQLLSFVGRFVISFQRRHLCSQNYICAYPIKLLIDLHQVTFTTSHLPLQLHSFRNHQQPPPLYCSCARRSSGGFATLATPLTASQLANHEANHKPLTTPPHSSCARGSSGGFAALATPSLLLSANREASRASAIPFH